MEGNTTSNDLRNFLKQIHSAIVTLELRTSQQLQ